MDSFSVVCEEEEGRRAEDPKNPGTDGQTGDREGRNRSGRFHRSHPQFYTYHSYVIG